MRHLIQAGSGRDLRVDLFRGLALWMILVNHAPNNALRPWTLHRFAFVDAADVFVLLAGYAAGLVYGRALDRQGWGRTAGASLRRAGVVYVAHVLMVVVLAATVGWLGMADHVQQMGLSPFAERPFEALREVLLLRLQPTNADILPIYVVFLARIMRRVVPKRANSTEMADPRISLQKTPRNRRLRRSSGESMACA
jgi:hypothetical protein